MEKELNVTKPGELAAEELTAEELEKAAGGMGEAVNGENLCSCGRGRIYINGMCRRCYELLQNK